MQKSEHPLSQKEFNSIFSKVPRLTVEIIVRNDSGEIYLTERAIEPCKGKWHLPGGTVRFGEPMTDAVKRIANRELNIHAITMKNVGYIEYPSHFQNGLDSPVGIVFEVTNFTGLPALNTESQKGRWLKSIPKNMHEEQDVFLVDSKYLTN